MYGMPFTYMYCGWLKTVSMHFLIIAVQCASSQPGDGMWLHHITAHLMCFANRAFLIAFWK